MCFKYSLCSLKAYSNDAIYHIFAKILKLSITKNGMCTEQLTGPYMDCNVGKKG